MTSSGRALTRAGSALTGCVVAVALAGCSGSGSPRADAAARAATAFTAAVASAPATACALLATDTRQQLEQDAGPCPASIGDADLPRAGQVLDVQVYGLDATVRLEHDTLFLALFDTGWRVTAAGCEPQEQDRPYSCQIKGS